MKAQKIHFIGIGGSGMSSLASLLLQMGKNVTGSDTSESAAIKNLQNLGIEIDINQSGKLISADKIVVYSAAITEDNLERKLAKKYKIQQYSYPEAIGQLTEQIPTISISGTHGKTTTTGLAYSGFLACGIDPSIIIGSSIPGLDNLCGKYGKDSFLILESCEYKRNFLNYTPKLVVINNIDLDHLDYFHGMADYINAFYEFALCIQENGILLINGDDQNAVKIAESVTLKRPDITVKKYGHSDSNDFILKNNLVTDKKGEIYGEFDLKLNGSHNLMNALAAFSACYMLSLDWNLTIKGINEFTGTSRRFEKIGSRSGTAIYDDYGHHPTEIKATLSGARQKLGKNAKILCIFQPHQFSRTFQLLDGFSNAFLDADAVIVTDIYEARDSDEDKKKVSSEKLVEKINEVSGNATYLGTFDEIYAFLNEKITSFDTVITMGAGDIWQVARTLATDAIGTSSR